MNFEAVKSFIANRLRAELPSHLTYHTIDHVLDVYQAAEMLADSEGVGTEDKLLLKTAVLFHDTGFLISQKDHEALSCDTASKYLPAYGYSPEQIEQVRGMIMATRLPQTPRNLLEEIICDADLDYLGRNDFYEIGAGLFQEFLHFGVVHGEEDWNRLQVRFLESHHYFTNTAQRLRKEKKEQRLNELKELTALS